MPAGKGTEDDEADKSQDNGNNSAAKTELAPKTSVAALGRGELLAYIRYGKTMLSLNVLATQMRFNGS